MGMITRLEEALLITIWKLKENAYGVTINQDVSRSTGKPYSMGALYFTLDQLFKKGYVSKSKGDPTPERGGRSKTFYCLTREGIKALQKARAYQAGLWEGVNGLPTGEEEYP